MLKWTVNILIFKLEFTCCVFYKITSTIWNAERLHNNSINKIAFISNRKTRSLHVYFLFHLPIPGKRNEQNFSVWFLVNFSFVQLQRTYKL